MLTKSQKIMPNFSTPKINFGQISNQKRQTNLLVKFFRVPPGASTVAKMVL